MASNKTGQYSNIKLSVFFPAYNEQENIKKTVENALSVLERQGLKDYEVIVVNDGSKDKTEQIVRDLQKNNKRVQLVTHNPNKGYGEALRSGYSQSKYDWIVFTDADGQFDFAEITKFLDKVDLGDYIIGYRMRRADNLFRLLAGKAWALSVFVLFGIWVKDIDCGFRMIKKSVVEKIMPLESTRGAMINAELLIKVIKKKYKVVQVGVHHYPRGGGASTGVRLNVIIKSYLDLFRLWLKLR